MHGVFFFFNDTATTEIYTLSLHDALPISKTNLLRTREYVVSTQPLRSKRIRDLFYETRTRLGKRCTLKVCAQEVFQGMVEAAMLGHIETGKRYPSQALVRRLAEIRKEDPKPLLALLFQERMVDAFGTELSRILQDDDEGWSRVDASQELSAGILEHALTLLPDDGAWEDKKAWRDRISALASQELAGQDVTDLVDEAVTLLNKEEIVEMKGKKVRLKNPQYVVTLPELRRRYAIRYCQVFSKALVERLFFHDDRAFAANFHFQLLDERFNDFKKDLRAALKQVVDTYDGGESGTGVFRNVVVCSTPE